MPITVAGLASPQRKLRQELLAELQVRRAARKECRRPAFYRQVSSYLPVASEDRDSGLGIQDHEREFVARALHELSGGREVSPSIVAQWMDEEVKGRFAQALQRARTLKDGRSLAQAVTAARSLSALEAKGLKRFLDPFFAHVRAGVTWSADIKKKVVRIPRFSRSGQPVEVEPTQQYFEWVTIERESEFEAIRDNDLSAEQVALRNFSLSQAR